MLMIVDLPLPEGPTIATISPAAIDRSTPRNAGYSSLPVRYTFSTPTSSINVAVALAASGGSVRYVATAAPPYMPGAAQRAAPSSVTIAPQWSPAIRASKQGEPGFLRIQASRFANASLKPCGRYLHAEHDPPEILRARIEEIKDSDRNAICLRR